MVPLNISDRRERLLVRTADLALAPFALRRRPRPIAEPRTIVCFRLERIGDLVMALPALAELRAAAPSAAIDLVVGSWNAELARAVPGIRSVEVLDASWLARGGGQSLPRVIADARKWKSRDYDVAINFEPDIRSNLIAAAVGAGWTAGFASGGGSALLDLGLTFDTTLHTTDNLMALTRAVARGWSGEPPPIDSRLQLDEDVRRRAAERLTGLRAPIVAMHVSGGRAIKQWPLDRFSAVARWAIEQGRASLVFTGTRDDAAANGEIRDSLPGASTLDVSGISLVEAAAVLERCDLLVTGDTGPMHLANAVGTPVVAIFGPSDPRRYAPRGLHDRVVRIDLPCAPCNRIRKPPVRCIGHTPDCLSGVAVAAVTSAIEDVLAHTRSRNDRITTVA